MPRRRTENCNDIVMNFRVSPRMKADIDNAADSAGTSSAEWIRKIIREKLYTGQSVESDAELEATIRKVVAEMIAEKKII